VHADIYEEFVGRLAEKARKMKVGDPLDPTTEMGSLISGAQMERVLGYIESGKQEGARLLCGGERDVEGEKAKGFFVKPTIFADVRPDMKIAQEEIFGPVLSIMTYRDEDEAARIANGTPYGLGGGVWAGSDERAIAFARRLRTGQVDINGGAFNARAPFGGYKQSGNGREMGRYGMEEFLEYKSLQLKSREKQA
jgi:acyl-CoA reductase-like NAD-dependent aldehyde dehydrogenase